MPRTIALVGAMLAAVVAVSGAVAAAFVGLPDELSPYVALAGGCAVACLGGAYLLDERPRAAVLTFGVGAATAAGAIAMVLNPALHDVTTIPIALGTATGMVALLGSATATASGGAHASRMRR